MTGWETIGLVVLDLALILAAARVVGTALARIGQPRVIGEILAGFLLGPSLLGALPGDLTAELFPTDVRPALKLIGQVGLALFMFTVGLDFQARVLRRHGRAAAAISAGSIVLPLTLGLLLAGYLHGEHKIVDGSEVPFTSFALFIGVAMSITAFPVLARILADSRLAQTPLGSLTLTAAAVDDVVGWSLLALAVSVVSSGGHVSWSAAATLVGAAAYTVLLLGVLRPLLARRLSSASPVWLRAHRPLLVAAVLAGLAASAAITEAIGVHFVFGSFVFGATLPRQVPEFVEPVRAILAVPGGLLLPVFFVTPGLSLHLDALGSRELVELAAVLAVACVGKFVGAFASARLFEVPRWEAAAVGILMNTRGLMELVVLAIGLEAGILDDRLFTVLVIMAITTTVITSPLLRLLPPLGAEWVSSQSGRRPVRA